MEQVALSITLEPLAKQVTPQERVIPILALTLPMNRATYLPLQAIYDSVMGFLIQVQEH